MSFLITSVLNCASDRLAISSLLSCIFSGALICSFIWTIFCVCWNTCYVKGRSLRCSPGRANAGRCAVTLYVGEGPRGSNGIRSSLHRISIFHSATHNETGPLWCWFPSGWACVRPRPLWVSPMTSPVRLGVFPAAAPTPMGSFNQRFEALSPCAGALGYVVCFAPRCLSGLSVCKCGAAGSASGQTACPVGPTLCQSRSRQGNASPLHPGRPSLPLLPVWMNVHFLFPWCRTSLLFDFLSVLVVGGGAVCPPKPPSWFSTLVFFIIPLHILANLRLTPFWFSFVSLYCSNIV